VKRVIAIIFLFVTIAPAWAQQSIPPVGFWREHLPYKSAIDVTAGAGKIYCATPYSLFIVNTGNNFIERWSRVTGLSETGISAIRYDENSQKLFIAYANSNIDIIYRNDIVNIPDIKRDNITGDKTIYNIYPLGDDFILSTGLGVIVINGGKYEVKDTWFIGNGGNQVKVNGFSKDGTFYYAATEEGLKKCPITSANPASHLNWQLVSGSNGLANGPCQNILTIQNNVFVQKNDSLFSLNGNTWSLFYVDGWSIVNTNSSENKLLISQRQANGISRVMILNADGTIFRKLENTGAVSYPRKVILFNNEPWVADQYACLSHFGSTASYEQFLLNSPQGVAGGKLIVNNSVFYATAGDVNDAWNYQYNGDGIYIFKELDWNNINRYKYPVVDSLLDYISLAVDPADQSIWAGSFGGGLLHVRNDLSFEIFKQNFIGETAGDPGSYRVSGLAFDKEQNLWISNFGALQPVKVRKKDGNWKNFTLPFILYANAVADIIIDENNYKWIIGPLGNGLICFDSGNDIENLTDDRWKKLGSGTGNGALPNSEVLCIAKDKNSYIWVGTTDGIGVIQCPGEIFSAMGCDAIRPIIPNGNFAGYLFKGQEVRDIAVDGADRKWVATKNGVFLISPEGEKVIYHFKEENSPLLSNHVKKMAIDEKTGEIYFATSKGICSFRSTATEAGDRNENVLVFPNPVPPGFSGTIAIRGLVNNAFVKITELDGRLVYQTRALGGQAVWDGRNYKGQKISSGVYLVLVSDEQRKEKVATKIFFVQQ